MNRFLCLLALLSMSACTVQDADVKLSNEYVFHDDYYYVFSSLSYTATKVHIIDSLDEYYFLFNSFGLQYSFWNSLLLSHQSQKKI